MQRKASEACYLALLHEKWYITVDSEQPLGKNYVYLSFFLDMDTQILLKHVIIFSTWI